MEEEEKNDGPSWRYLAIGAVTLVFTSTCYFVGDYISTTRKKLEFIQQALDSRASLPPRVEALERSDTDKEIRLRTIEREYWKQGNRH